MKGSGSPTRHTVGHTIVIHLPDPRLLLSIARLAIVAAAVVFSIPWLRRIPPRGTMVRSYDCSDDDPFNLPMLIRDLEIEGIFTSNSQKRAIFLGNANCKLPFDHVPSDQESTVGDQSIDFALASEGFDDSSVRVVDRVLKIGGIAVTRLNSDGSSNPFHLPSNYKLVYVRRFGYTIVALRKIAQSNSQKNGINGDEIKTGKSGNRKLLAIQIEDVLLEPPREIGETRKIKYLPELTGDPLTRYPRRVMRAEAGIVEEMVKGKEEKAILITRAFWECLALYGKVKDRIVIHQWWD